MQRVPNITGRHGNGSFVCGYGDDPTAWIECRFYYGGRSSLTISGSPVEPVDKKVALVDRHGPFTVRVTMDRAKGMVRFEAGGHVAETPIKSLPQPITHYGYGGANSDNLFTAIEVR